MPMSARQKRKTRKLRKREKLEANKRTKLLLMGWKIRKLGTEDYYWHPTDNGTVGLPLHKAYLHMQRDVGNQHG